MKYKFSQFNIISTNDTILLFNTKTLSLIELDDELYKIFINKNHELLNNCNENTKKILFENGFIIPINSNEINSLKELYWNEKNNSKILHISVMTTLDCNFRCIYCFEERRKIHMNSDIQDSIVKYIKSEMYKYDIIHIDWYGGEPLLNLDCIENISLKLMEICKKNKKDFLGTITTNGYNLTNDIVDKLCNLNVKSIYVTIDGPRTIHNKRRILAGNIGTFDTIIKNIKYAKNYMNVGIRVNVDKNSINYIDELLKFLKENNLNNCPVSIKGVVSANANPCEEVMLSEVEFSNKILEKNKLILDLGLTSASIDMFKNITPNFCIVDSDSQFIISPDGGVYKCGESYDKNDVGNIGDLTLNGKMNINKYKKSFWDKDPFEYKECLECKVLPMCMGGCQLKRKVKCKEWCNPELKNNLKELIDLYYYNLKIGADNVEKI